MEFEIQSKKHGTQTVFIDDEDWKYIKHWKWGILKNGNTYYCIRSKYIKKKRYIIRLHSFIMGYEGGLLIDHKDNLRLCTPRQNSANRTPKRNATSKYLGVAQRVNNMTYIKSDGDNLCISTNHGFHA